ncbi:MAG: TonB-dependent receptor [Gammaproteobacteria bacterium]|nr:TonB-dependent receptor [Gammaproteobacteria bacterium]
MSSHRAFASSLLGLTLVYPLFTAASGNDELQQLREEIKQVRETYEARIQRLEKRLKDVEQGKGIRASSSEPLAETASAPRVTRGNASNPDISLILSGAYSNLQRNPDSYRISGFQPGGEIGPGTRGFSLAESELVLSANIDPYFYGLATLAIAPDDSISVEEGFVQTTALSHGLTAKAGRFYSGIGYLNEHHAHTWDFVDNPLAYQAFLGRQFGTEGVQVKWVAPTDTYLELGGEAGRGSNFPGSERNSNNAGAYSLFTHTGGDVGASHSWRAGLSRLHAAPRAREYSDTDVSGVEVANSFSGDSDLWIADFIWKYAPGGNSGVTNFNLQGEYFRRREDGTLGYDLDSASLGTQAGDYSSTQSGLYLQGVYQFIPRWRIGLRGDWLDVGHVDYGANSGNLLIPNHNPSRYSLMIDYSPSEFSRFRIQFAHDKARTDETDNQFYLQYIMSLGAHGGHKF